MLIRDYQGISDRTVIPVGKTKSCRRGRSWAWDRKHAEPGRVTVVKYTATQSTVITKR